jgi:hypothetical protein
MNRSIRLRPALRLQHYRAGVQVQALPLPHVAVRVIQPSLLFVPSLSWEIIGFRMEIECGSDDLMILWHAVTRTRTHTRTRWTATTESQSQGATALRPQRAYVQH